MVEEQGQERPGRSTELPGQDELQALATLKVELRSEHEKNCGAYFRCMSKNHQRRKPDLARRSAIIQGIPCLWAIALSFLLPLESAAQEEEEVQKTFPSSLPWQVQLQSHPWSHCKVIFSFQDHPYFLSTVITTYGYLDIVCKTWLPG